MADKLAFKLDASEWQSTFDDYVRESRRDAKTLFTKKVISLSFRLFKIHQDFKPKIVAAITSATSSGKPIRIRKRIRDAMRKQIAATKARLVKQTQRFLMNQNRGSAAAQRTLAAFRKTRDKLNQLRGWQPPAGASNANTADNAREREIKARKRAAGYSAGRVWKVAGRSLDQLAVKDRRGQLTKNIRLDELSATLANNVRNMGAFVDRTKYTQRALFEEVEDMRAGIIKLVKKRMEKGTKR